jgi:hypothetical protein
MPEIQRLLRNDSALLGTRDYASNAELGIRGISELVPERKPIFFRENTVLQSVPTVEDSVWPSYQSCQSHLPEAATR